MGHQHRVSLDGWQKHAGSDHAVEWMSRLDTSIARLAPSEWRRGNSGLSPLETFQSQCASHRLAWSACVSSANDVAVPAALPGHLLMLKTATIAFGLAAGFVGLALVLILVVGYAG